MSYDYTQAIPSVGISTEYSGSTSKTSLSMNDFLKIMSAAMQNPSIDSDSSSGSSSSGTDYVSQMAQFASLDQLNNIGKSLTTTVMGMQQNEAFSLLGKNVQLADGSTTVSGKVDKVKFSNGYATLVVNGNEYQMGALTEVDNDTTN
ncbi:MAG: flagellar hook capping FlgD N-terminal domain-containing protein [Liquorilactobacillus hordei]|uniref:Flagellar basal body rod modification protein n=1 Tax=Liquorilactobacillus hordei TaxID=468911 RepID=A0A3Q8CMQ2_9LACO|nr:flagellar hook capping FlgD N-terminal domain-containing protein [Liquorilactobacillus hordei]AUJ30662.1 flagellar basal body rod modification protein [Liquorilactobacillus hordei]MBZ2405951.1 flagellar basal body rod modification protein [Liquorilactobacillus hordei]